MAWTTAPSADMDWSALTFFNQFPAALNERGQSLGTFAVGNDIQNHANFEAWQEAIEKLLTSFLVSHDTGTKRADDYYLTNNLTNYTTLASLMSAAGLTNSNWRRYTTHGTDLGGQCQAGDIIGPWLFEDLYKCINALIWSGYSPSWTNSRTRTSEQESIVSWADAKSLVEAAYSAETDTNFSPCQVSMGDQGTLGGNPPVTWRASLTGTRAKTNVSGMLPASKSISHYVYCKKYTGVFDDNGTSFVVENTWVKWLTTLNNEDINFTSTVYFGSTTMPNWCDPPNFDFKWKGWIIGDTYPNTKKAVARYNFVYQ
jgi:hypothetical protein